MSVIRRFDSRRRRCNRLLQRALSQALHFNPSWEEMIVEIESTSVEVYGNYKGAFG